MMGRRDQSRPSPDGPVWLKVSAATVIFETRPALDCHNHCWVFPDLNPPDDGVARVPLPSSRRFKPFFLSACENGANAQGLIGFRHGAPNPSSRPPVEPPARLLRP